MRNVIGILDLLQQPLEFAMTMPPKPKRSYHENVRRPYWRQSSIGISC